MWSRWDSRCAVGPADNPHIWTIYYKEKREPELFLFLWSRWDSRCAVGLADNPHIWTIYYKEKREPELSFFVE